jgi:nicotinamidase/pyrazinamidase
MAAKKEALIIIDVQKDFCPGGALAVAGGDEIVPVINGLVSGFSVVVATQDWHPRGHVSFASSHDGKNPYDQINLYGTPQTLWPNHCVAGTSGADFHPGLDTSRLTCIIRKGTAQSLDSYSAFIENDKKTPTGLDGYLTRLGVDSLALCGLATDYCVFFSAMDGAALGFSTTVLLDACRGIDVPAGSLEARLEEMKARGIALTHSGTR